jgi:hypothetical protein|tara:strand:- start:604 stop:1119 length:516 start_codon:yes stop_codon:yes gene_type:complete
MKSFKQYITENTTVTLKTPKGSRVGRSTKYGIGKTMGSDTWVHKDYMHKVIPPNILRNALEVLPEDFKYNTVKYNDKTRIVRFESSDNFDSAREPFAGEYINVFPNGEVVSGKSNAIWHHKWQWVLDDYKGFDVEESYNWSKYYLENLKIVSKGGSQLGWDKQLADVGYNK